MVSHLTGQEGRLAPAFFYYPPTAKEGGEATKRPLQLDQ